MIDLTAGLGIDAMTIAANGNVVIAVEQDKNKANILLHNANVLELSDFKVVNDDCINFLESLRSYPDYFFIDPARRDSANKRTYALSECTPDVTSIYRKLIEKGSTLYIKASPLLDVTAILHQLESVSEIFIISVKNECKEVLIKMEQGKVWPPRLTAIDLDDEGIKSSFSFEEDNSNEKKKVSPTIASIEEIRKDTFLYEPNAALMKLNAGKQICKHYECLKKASANTELFLSNDFIEKFPGRVIKIERFLTSKDLKGVKGKGYSVATRNYPMKAEDLKKKLGVKENPENFIYAFRVGVAGKPVIIEGKRMEAKG
ncbi:MAG: hypothetical protein K2H76_00975 [Muribaculaceae bacterium]|nr:hypothetical protein [Muribaculaceae bacterium]